MSTFTIKVKAESEDLKTAQTQSKRNTDTSILNIFENIDEDAIIVRDTASFTTSKTVEYPFATLVNEYNEPAVLTKILAIIVSNNKAVDDGVLQITGLSATGIPFMGAEGLNKAGVTVFTDPETLPVTSTGKLILESDLQSGSAEVLIIGKA